MNTGKNISEVNPLQPVFSSSLVVSTLHSKNLDTYSIASSPANRQRKKVIGRQRPLLENVCEDLYTILIGSEQ